MTWFERHPDVYRREIAVLAERHPDLQIGVQDGHVVVTGLFRVSGGTISNDGFSIQIVVPDDYPDQPPELFLSDDRVPRTADRHMESSGKACPCVRGDIRRFWRNGSCIADFIEKLIYPFLLGQMYAELNGGKWPWGERDHGAGGIIEFYAAELGVGGREEITALVKLLARKEPAKGHTPCPCGSGKKLRDCHRAKYVELRQLVTSKEAETDLSFLTGPQPLEHARSSERRR